MLAAHTVAGRDLRVTQTEGQAEFGSLLLELCPPNFHVRVPYICH